MTVHRESRGPGAASARAVAALRRVGRALARMPRAAALLLALGWMTLIWSLSSVEHGPGPGALRRARFLTNLAHAPEFGLLALWLALLVPRRADGWIALTPARALLVWCVTVAYAIADELHQLDVPGREGTGWDVMTDGVGAACVLWIARYLGSAGATERGLWRRLLAGALACAASATVAAYHHRWLGV